MKTMMSKPANADGFTLIELLAVLAVMAMLALLLVPVLQRRPLLSRDNEVDRFEAVMVAARQQAKRRVALPINARWQPTYPALSESPGFAADRSPNGGIVEWSNGQQLRLSWIDGSVIHDR